MISEICFLFFFGGVYLGLGSMKWGWLMAIYDV